MAYITSARGEPRGIAWNERIKPRSIPDMVYIAYSLATAVGSWRSRTETVDLKSSIQRRDLYAPRSVSGRRSRSITPSKISTMGVLK